MNVKHEISAIRQHHSWCCALPHEYLKEATHTSTLINLRMLRLQ